MTTAAAALRLTPLHPAIGAGVAGIDLSRPITEAQRDAILSAHIGRIRGWQTPEALLFLQDLAECATQRKFVYQHVWQAHDLVIWDNRATMHRGRPFDSQIYPRDLRRVTVQGSASTLEESV